MQLNQTTRTLMFRNSNESTTNINYANSNLEAKDGNFNFEIAEKINVSASSSSLQNTSATALPAIASSFSSLRGGVADEAIQLNNNQTITINSNHQPTTINSSNSSYLDYLNNNKSEITNLTKLESITLRESNAVRGTTDACTAVIAIGATAAIITTGGAAAAGASAATAAGATAGGAVATGAGMATAAAASSLASTAAVSATNTSMNAQGDFFKQAKTISNDTYQTTTSKESLENAAIAGATAAITFGVTQGINKLVNMQNANDVLNATNNTSTQLSTNLDPSFKTLYFDGNPVPDYGQFSSVTNSVSLTKKTISAIQNSATQTISTSVAQSAVKGDSLEEALKNSGKNIIINAMADIAIGEIASAAKDQQINSAAHLVAIAGVGCLSGAASSGDCAASATSSVIGALAGDLSHNNKEISKEQTSAIAKVAGAVAGAAIGGPDNADAVFAASNAAAITQNIYHEVGLQLTKEEEIKFNEAVANNNTKEVLRIIEQKNIKLDDATKEKIRQKVEGEIGGNEFVQSLTTSERWDLVQPKSIGVFFDGTGNDDKPETIAAGHETNVYKMMKLYDGEFVYETGVGTDGGLDKICLGVACGIDKKEQSAMNNFADIYNKDNRPFVITDLVGFSRGAATAVDFGNKILEIGITSSKTNQLIPSDLIVVRSELLFDNVASAGVPGNNIDYGLNLKIPKDVIVIHATAEDENRNLFDLQSIKNKNGSLNNPNWIEQSFPGVHSDVGGFYAKGEQGKENDIAKYTLNWMVDKSNQSILPLNNNQNIFKELDAANQPSFELVDLMNFYQESKANNNQSNIDAAKILLQQKYIHKEEFSLSSPWNYDIGSERGIFYQDSN